MGDQAEAAGPGADEKKCPDCAEKVKAEARICWRCRYEFRPADAASDKVVPFPGREGALAELLERQPAKPKIYYASDGIEVSAARVLINGSEYPIRNISAFEVQRVIASYGWAIFFWTLTVICALIDFSAVKNGGAAPLFFMAFLFGAIGLLLTHSANEKSGYAILISTGGGQNKALLHKDEAFARTIAAAIGQAVSDYR